MNEQDLIKSIEEANSIEEVREAALKAGIDNASFDALLEAVDKKQDEEISDDELENVNGGLFFLPTLIGLGVGRYIALKIKKIRQNRYQTGYDEEIMSDNRLGGTCENKK